jgi:3-oxoadipate enol-lactonase
VPWCRSDEVDLYYERAGQGERLLFISGTGGDLRAEPTVMKGVFPDAFDVVGYDQRGLGQSSVPDRPYAMADYAADAARLLDEVGWDSCLVLGASFGGMVAQELAIRHGDRVRRLVLACTSAGGRGGSSYPLHELAKLERKARAAKQLEILDTRWDADWQTTHPDEWHTMVVGIVRTLPGAAAPDEERARGAELQLEARSHHDTADRLGRITCPTLVCAGRYDGTAPPANSEFLAAEIPGAELAYFEGGHVFMLQDRSAFPAMIDFLSRPS